MCFEKTREKDKNTIKLQAIWDCFQKDDCGFLKAVEKNIDKKNVQG